MVIYEDHNGHGSIVTGGVLILSPYIIGAVLVRGFPAWSIQFWVGTGLIVGYSAWWAYFIYRVLHPVEGGALDRIMERLLKDDDE